MTGTSKKGLPMRHSRTSMIGISLVLSLSAGAQAQDSASPEELCLAARQQAAGLYFSCQATEFGRYLASATLGHKWEDLLRWRETSSSCRSAYVRKWADFQAAFPGTTCAGPRFVDNGNGTISDNLTGYTWQKDSPETSYTWSASIDDTRANGTVFTEYLEGLNREGSCSAGQCDWRLPTLAELQTLLNRPWGQCIENGGTCRYWATGEVCDCAVCSGPEVVGECNPCMDRIFGGRSGSYWVSDEDYYDWDPAPSKHARFIFFKDGDSSLTRAKYRPNNVRAIRGGL